MSCRELKAMVAANPAYPKEFRRLINSMTDDHVAKLIIEENSNSGILDPSSDFVLHKTLLVRTFVKLGFITELDDYYASSMTLSAMFQLMKVLFSLELAAEKEKFPVGELHSQLMRDVNFQSAVMNLSPFFQG